MNPARRVGVRTRLTQILQQHGNNTVGDGHAPHDAQRLLARMRDT
jgi:hypothetical protein